MHVSDHPNEAQQLVCLSAIAQCEHHVVGCHYAKVAVKNVEWVDIECGGACRGQCCCYLRAYMSALAYTGDDDLAMAVEHHAYGGIEVVVYLRN